MNLSEARQGLTTLPKVGCLVRSSLPGVWRVMDRSKDSAHDVTELKIRMVLNSDYSLAGGNVVCCVQASECTLITPEILEWDTLRDLHNKMAKLRSLA